MKRRDFLTIAAGGVAGGAALAGLRSRFVRAAEKQPVDVRDFFDSDDAEVLALTQRVFDKCILETLRPPAEPLRHTWVQPGGPYYLGQWIWDTMFVVDLLSVLPDKKQVIRDIFQNYWDFQDRWNTNAPEYARDMITVAIKTAPQEVRQFSQIPILAWGVERVYRRNGDKELLRQCLGRLERFHEWYWRERDLHDNGLITLGAYTGKLQHAKWETFDYECNMDGMKMTVHPKRKGPKEGAWYADICVPGNTAYLILAERSLARLADVAGDKPMAARRKLRVEKGVQGMRDHLWDDKAGTFLSVRRDTLEKIAVATIGSWIPLAAGVPTPAQAKRMAEVLASPAWMTPLPVPTVDRTDERWKSDAFWRGDVWPPTNYQIAGGLAAYGHEELAADICDKTIANAIRNGISEHYDSISGKPLGVRDYCMSCTLVTMMLDGLARKHQLKLSGGLAAAAEPSVPGDYPGADNGRFIDAHVHFHDCRKGDLEKVAEWMKANDVRRCINHPLAQSRPKNDAERQQMLGNYAQYKGRIDRFCVIFPEEVDSVDEAVKLLAREKRDGAIGFGEHYGVDLKFDDPKNLRLYEACAKVGLPVMFHYNDKNKNVDEKGMPRLERVLKLHPTCILIAHGDWWKGLSDGACDRLLRTCPNLYADISCTVKRSSIGRDKELARAFFIRHADKLLFGTDSGWWSFGKQPMPEFSLIDDLKLPKEVEDRICRRNAERLFWGKEAANPPSAGVPGGERGR